MFNAGLLQFLQQSPSPFHAVASMSDMLLRSGFVALDEGESWQLAPDARYFVTRNGSSIIAFTTGSGDPVTTGIRMTGAHTDSPCLKVKPDPLIRRQGLVQFGVEVYGGALLAPWFDRDLSIAGRVDYRSSTGELQHCLLDLQSPVAVIPSLAIHLDREANQNRSINAQTDLPPVLALVNADSPFDFQRFVMDQVRNQTGHESADVLLGHELVFYDTQPPAMTGLNGEFISSARLDNLLSCYVCTKALLDADSPGFSLMVCNDHEEVGSASACGAQGPFLESVLQRIVDARSEAAGREAWERMLRRSLFLSIDNAHGIHPNFADKHDSNHGPLLNKGPVLKINANQRYASNSRSMALFRDICHQVDVPVQTFVMRSDMGCGSTIGPITASGIGVETVDVGVPTFAMHSIRELAGSQDAAWLERAVRHFYARAN